MIMTRSAGLQSVLLSSKARNLEGMRRTDTLASACAVAGPDRVSRRALGDALYSPPPIAELDSAGPSANVASLEFRPCQVPRARVRKAAIPR